MAKKYIGIDKLMDFINSQREKLESRTVYKAYPRLSLTQTEDGTAYLRNPHEIAFERIDARLAELDDVEQFIKNSSPADVRESVHGEWTEVHHKGYKEGWTGCSICGAVPHPIHTNFCPCCGADMRKGKTDGE